MLPGWMRFVSLTLVVLTLAGASMAAPPRPTVGPDDQHPTDLRFLPGNHEAWYARWKIVSEAQHSLDLTYFNFHKDLFGKALLGLVRHKAQQGLRVRLMVDGRGSLNLATRFFAQAYLRDLATFPDVDVRIYKPLTGVLLELPKGLRAVIASNHDKIILADGAWAVMGGRNLGEKYFSHPDEDPDAYRDNDLLLHGAGVGAEVEAAFAAEFEHLANHDLGLHQRGDRAAAAREVEVARRVMDRWIRGQGELGEHEVDRRDRRLLRKMLKEMRKHPRLTAFEQFQAAPLAGGGRYPVRILDKRSFGDPDNDITDRMIALMDSAEHELLIQNAYMVLTDKVKAAFQRASARGVRIRFLTNSPSTTNNLLTQAFFVRDWAQWLVEVPRLEIYMTNTGHKIHAKTFVVDGRVASVGSYNMDPMSESINSELMALVEHPAFAAQVTERLERDLEASERCVISVDDEGNVTPVHGPDDHLKGLAGIAIRILSKVPFLRDLV